MEIQTVKREAIPERRISRRTKYQPLLEAIRDLEPGGDALEVRFDSEAELTSMRNLVYHHNRKYGEGIKSSKHPSENIVFFYK